MLNAFPARQSVASVMEHAVLVPAGGHAYSRTFTRTAKSAGPHTPLLEMILRKYELRHVDDLLGLAYGANAKFASWDEVAGLAPLVFEVCVLACLRACALSRAGKSASFLSPGYAGAHTCPHLPSLTDSPV